VLVAEEDCEEDPDTALETVWEIRGCTWDTTWDTIEDCDDGLLEELEEMVELGPEVDEELATIEETDSDISGCNWARIEAIRSDCENEEADNDPEEVVDDDPDEDDCC